MDAVGIHQFSVVEAVYQVFIVIGRAVIRLLDATTGRGVVPCNGQSDHGAVRQVDRTLHQSFAERTSAYDDTSVPVLHCAAHDFAGGSGVFVYQYDEAAVTELSVSFGEELAALCGPAFGVNNQFLLSEEFVGKVDGGVQISSAVALQVEDEVFHALLLQAFHCLLEFFGGGCAKAVDADVSDLWLNHVGSVETQDRYLISFHGEHERVLYSTADDGQVDFRTFRATQALHDIFRAHFYSCDGGVVDGNDAVAGKDAHFLGGAVADGLYDQQGVLDHLELYADAFEVALKRFVHLLHFFGIRVSGVRVELCQHLDDSFFYHFVFIYFVYVEVGNREFRHLEFAHGGGAETLGLYSRRCQQTNQEGVYFNLLHHH